MGDSRELLGGVMGTSLNFLGGGEVGGYKRGRMTACFAIVSL